MPSFEVHHYKLRCLITAEEALESFESLKRKCENIESCVMAAPSGCQLFANGSPAPKFLGIFRLGHSGTRFSKYFHWKMLAKVSSNTYPSANDLLAEWKRGSSEVPTMMKSKSCSAFEAVRRLSALKSASHFRPCVSASLAILFDARMCLDFCAGWGNRLTGFMAAPNVEEIDLIEPRSDAANAYINQHHLVGSKTLLNVYRGAAEDVLPTLHRKYDLIISSPPYMNLEIYTGKREAGRHLQVSERYADVKAYLEDFLIPITVTCLKRLRTNGIFCINISDSRKKGIDVCRVFLERVVKLTRGKYKFVGTIGYAITPDRNFFYKKSHGCFVGEPIYVFSHAAFASKARKMISDVVAAS